MTDTFKSTWEMGKDTGVRSNTPLLSYTPSPLPSTTPFLPLPLPSAPTHGIASGGGGGGAKSSEGNRQPQLKKPEKPRQVYHCQACGRKDAWHKDGTTCPALLQGSTDANPSWNQGVTWEASPQGIAAMARGQYNAFPPRSKYRDRHLDPESEWEGFECSYINNIGKGCSTVLIFPFNSPLDLPLPILTQESPAKDRLAARGLIDTGADLSFISDRLAGILKEKGVGVRGIGNYKVIDAFLKVHFFNENITLNFFFKDLINSKFNR